MIDTNDLHKKLEAAPPRPWGIWCSEAADDSRYSICSSDLLVKAGWIEIAEEHRHACVAESRGANGQESLANAHLIVAAVNTLPELLLSLERYKQTLRDLRTSISSSRLYLGKGAEKHYRNWLATIDELLKESADD